MPKQKKITAKETPKAGVEVGRSGTNIFKGIINEEYVSDLSGSRAMKTYDEMRKSDATVKAALGAVQLPIRRAKWFVNPASEEDIDREIADFISSALFEYQGLAWDDFLRQALLSTAYGVMVFEKVFDVRTVNGRPMIVWKKFAPRLPNTITAWELSDGSEGIKQTTLQGGEAEIPLEKLLVFNNEKEGDNWWGIALLRPAYKHWYIKTNLEKIDAIAHERQGLGVPSVELDDNASEADVLQAETILSNMRAHEKGYLIERKNMKVEFKDMKSSSTKDPARAIDYHNRQITLAVLAQFLMLGSGASGSYALSKDHSELFLQALEAVASSIADVINKYAIPQLVDLNYDNVSIYPKLDFAGISRTDVDALSVAYQRLVQSGGIKPIEADEVYLRKIMGLPEREEEDMAEEDTTEDPEDITEDLGLPEGADKKPVENSEIKKAVARRIAKFSDNATRIDYLEKMIISAKTFSDKYKGIAAVKDVLYASLSDLKKKSFTEENDFKGWRALTFAEKKVALKSIQSFMNEKEAEFSDNASSMLKEITEVFIDRLNKAVQAGDFDKIKDLEMGRYTEYRDMIKGHIKRAFEFGKNNAAREMDVKAPGNPSDFGKKIEMYADAIATKHHYEIETKAKLAINNEVSKFGEKEIAAIAAAVSAITGSSKDIVANTAAVIISDAINRGRALVFDKNGDKVYALQRSEILDETTCNFCLSIDGRIVDKKDSLAQSTVFHSNCRGIWVEILNDEEELPSIDGVPDSIRDRVGEAVNELVQPKNPIVKKSSPAGQMLSKKKKK